MIETMSHRHLRLTNSSTMKVGSLALEAGVSLSHQQGPMRMDKEAMGQKEAVKLVAFIQAAQSLNIWLKEVRKVRKVSQAPTYPRSCKTRGTRIWINAWSS